MVGAGDYIYIAQGFTLQKWCTCSLPRLSTNKLAIIWSKCGISFFNHGCFQECQRILQDQIGEKSGLPRGIRWSRWTLFFFTWFSLVVHFRVSPPSPLTVPLNCSSSKAARAGSLRDHRQAWLPGLLQSFLQQREFFIIRKTSLYIERIFRSSILWSYVQLWSLNWAFV